MLSNLLLLAAGLVLLTLGADYLVRGAISFANRLGMPPLLIGLTVVGFGTSMPELLVSLQAALDGAPAIAVGNVVGSNIANILLILGLAAADFANSGGDSESEARHLDDAVRGSGHAGPGLSGLIGFMTGLAMFTLLAAYLAWVTYTDRRRMSDEEAELVVKLAGWKEALFIAGGLVGLFAGANLLINAATSYCARIRHLRSRHRADNRRRGHQPAGTCHVGGGRLPAAIPKSRLAMSSAPTSSTSWAFSV
jgi:cation:H+ antiporter